MIHISNALTIQGKPSDYTIESAANIQIDAQGLTVFPGLIDPHVHFRTPGMEYKEDWITGSKAAICGGYTTVFDMPNTVPPTISAQLLQEKKSLINSQLQIANIPLHYQLFFGADKKHFSQIHAVKEDIIGIKVFMGCSTGNLVIDDDESLHAVFAIAASQNLLVAVHAEDEIRIKERKRIYSATHHHYQDHSFIRDIEVATLAVEKAIALSKIYGTRLYILHVSSEEEIELIKKAKQAGLSVFAETTPHHLFLNDGAYQQLQGRAVVNPPLRDSHHQAMLFQAIQDNIIDTIGSDHAPHTVGEKEQAYGMCPSGMPGIETTLPLLLTAYHQGYISLEKIISLTVTRPQTIFKLEENHDMVLVDLNQKLNLSHIHLQTKCQWTPYENWTLIGWPVFTILNNQCFDLTKARIKHV